jgi:hypothetical protein
MKRCECRVCADLQGVCRIIEQARGRDSRSQSCVRWSEPAESCAYISVSRLILSANGAKLISRCTFPNLELRYMAEPTCQENWSF